MVDKKLVLDEIDLDAFLKKEELKAHAKAHNQKLDQFVSEKGKRGLVSGALGGLAAGAAATAAAPKGTLLGASIAAPIVGLAEVIRASRDVQPRRIDPKHVDQALSGVDEWHQKNRQFVQENWPEIQKDLQKIVEKS